MTPLVSPERKEQLKRFFEFARSRLVDIRSVETVCLALGPYRNLTTLTASLMALHPNCQVLNHAGKRIFADRRLNFLDDYSDAKFNAFVRYAIFLSQGGARGAQGGSILHSHAFDHEALRTAYQQRFGEAVRKPMIRSVFWKESLRTSNLIRDRNVDLDSLFRRNQKLRFLMPVRNPLDCAYSNCKTGHLRLFHGLDDGASVHHVLPAVVREFAWFLDQQDRNPERFFFFYEHSFTADTAQALAEFLRIPADAGWIKGVMSAFQVEGPYDHDPDLIDEYTALIEKTFAKRPDVAGSLLQFVQGSPRRGDHRDAQ